MFFVLQLIYFLQASRNKARIMIRNSELRIRIRTLMICVRMKKDLDPWLWIHSSAYGAFWASPTYRTYFLPTYLTIQDIAHRRPFTSRKVPTYLMMLAFRDTDPNPH